jgi:hypothetical protein
MPQKQKAKKQQATGAAGHFLGEETRPTDTKLL